MTPGPGDKQAKATTTGAYPMTDLFNRVYAFGVTHLRRDEGQTFAEYALIGVLIIVAVAAVLGTLTTDLQDAFTKIEKANTG